MSSLLSHLEALQVFDVSVWNFFLLVVGVMYEESLLRLMIFSAFNSAGDNPKITLKLAKSHQIVRRWMKTLEGGTRQQDELSKRCPHLFYYSYHSNYLQHITITFHYGSILLLCQVIRHYCRSGAFQASIFNVGCAENERDSLQGVYHKIQHTHLTW